MEDCLILYFTRATCVIMFLTSLSCRYSINPGTIVLVEMKSSVLLYFVILTPALPQVRELLRQLLQKSGTSEPIQSSDSLV